MSVFAKTMKGAVLVGLLLVGLTGCVAIGTVDRTAGRIDQSVGSSRNSSILLNIVRASRAEPLYFYSISRVSGSGTEDFRISFPAFTLGPHQTASQRNLTFGYNGLSFLDSQESGSFDVAVLESRNFYYGMLQPLTLDEVNVILHEGFARELIYRLSVESVTIYGDDGLHRYVNDVSSDSYGAFNAFFVGAMTHGVTIETFQDVSAAPKADKTALALSDRPAGSSYTSRLCFDPALVQNPQALADDAASGNECSNRPPPTSADEQAFPGDLKTAYERCTTPPAAAAQAGVRSTPSSNPDRVCAHLGGKVYAVQLNTRSLFGIYAYLGSLLRDQRNVELLGLGAPVEPRTKGSLMLIESPPAHPCFAAVTYGGKYCIPQEGSENLKMIFSLLNALQALKTSVGDLPVTAPVRIEQ